jgi:hypothetical protein
MMYDLRKTGVAALKRAGTTASAALVAVAFSAAAASAASLLVNGDFEDTSGSVPGTGLANGMALGDLASGPGAAWDVFTEIPGWKSNRGPGIEVQTARTGIITPQSGGHYVELDSHTARNTNSNMFQDLMLDKGKYELSFWYSPRKDNPRTNRIRYSVNGGALLAGGVTGPQASNGTSVGIWTLFSETFLVAADATDVRLAFNARGIDDTLGGFIDSVSVSAVPLPAAGLLLMGGMGGLGFVSRRRKKA